MEMKYCIYCGRQNSPEAKFCVKCGKEMEPKENLLADFLLKRTKDKLKGSADDSLYNIIKNFLLSHLYGVALTISFVSAVVVTASASDAHIKKVDSAYINNLLNDGHQQQSQHQSQMNNGEYSHEDNSSVHTLMTTYEIEVFNETLRDSEGNPVAPEPDKHRLPASRGYAGQHQLNSSLPTYIPGANESGSKSRTEFNPENFQTDIAKKLAADGYKVGESKADAVFTDIDGTVVCSYEYLVVAVFYEGQWLVAEDLLLSFDSDYVEPVVETEQQEEPTQTVVEIDRDAVIDTASKFYNNVFDGNDMSDMHFPDSFAYDCQHQLNYDADMPTDRQNIDTETQYLIITAVEDFMNPVSAKLYNDGYATAEYYAHQIVMDMDNSYNVIGTRDFCITVVEMDGQWYIAEDILMERVIN